MDIPDDIVEEVADAYWTADDDRALMTVRRTIEDYHAALVKRGLDVPTF